MYPGMTYGTILKTIQKSSVQKSSIYGKILEIIQKGFAIKADEIIIKEGSLTPFVVFTKNGKRIDAECPFSQIDHPENLTGVPLEDYASMIINAMSNSDISRASFNKNIIPRAYLSQYHLPNGVLFIDVAMDLSDKNKYILLGLTYEDEEHSILTDFEGEDILKVFGMERDEFYSFLKTLNGMPLKRIWRNEKNEFAYQQTLIILKGSPWIMLSESSNRVNGTFEYKVFKNGKLFDSSELFFPDSIEKFFFLIQKSMIENIAFNPT